MLCDGLAHRSAVLAAERVRRRIASAFSEAASPVTASIGVSTAPLDGPDLASLLDAANQRLYVAKAGGGDRIAGHPEAGGGNVAPFPRQAPA